jgi:uncharacterized protein YkwD
VLSAILLTAAAGLPSEPAVVALRIDAPAAVHDAHAPTSCLPDGLDREREGLLSELNALRRAQGLAAIGFSPPLCRSAQERAREIGRLGSAGSSVASMVSLGRRIREEGYDAFKWRESSLVAYGKPEQLLEALESRDPGSYRQAVLGDFEHAGIGIGAGPEGVVRVFLFALPQRTELERKAAPLSEIERVRGDVLDEVNEQRRQAGRAPLIASHALHAVAQRHAEDMLLHGYYDHRGLDGSSSLQRVLASGYMARFVAENIAKGLFTPRQAVERWMASSGHRRNILSAEAREIGFGVAAGDGPRDFDVLWVMVLARPRGTV